MNKRIASLKSGKFHSSPVSVDDTGKVIIEFPAKVASYFGLDRNSKKIFWSPTNGVIQICGTNQNHVVIPATEIVVENFEAQPA